MKDQNLITKAEMEVLRAVMEHQPATVRTIADVLGERKGVARTTVLTLMERLRSKGQLSREEVGGINHYSATRSSQEVFSGAVNEFVNTTLGGSVSPFFAYLVETGQLSKDEIESLERLAKKLEEENR